MNDENVCDVMPLRVEQHMVVLKVFPPRKGYEYYFRYFPDDGHWRYEEKDSGEEFFIHPDNALELVHMAEECLSHQPPVDVTDF